MTSTMADKWPRCQDGGDVLHHIGLCHVNNSPITIIATLVVFVCGA